jgi:peptidoglycan/LPS O-acetylase OafA/YrhL
VSSREYLHGLDLLRAVASSLVVYTHLANWFATRRRSWWFSEWLHDGIVAPLHLNPNLSFAGVSLFLLISGVVVTHVAARETPGPFLRRRLVRIVPLLLLASVLAWLLVNVAGYRPESGQHSLDLGDLLTGMTLAGFFTTPEIILLGIAWTLLVQIVFYGYVAATMPLLRRRAWLAPALAAVLVCTALSLVTGSGSVAGHRIGMIAAFLPVLCIGQLISLARTGALRPVVAAMLGCVHFLLFVWADRLGEYMLSGNAFGRTLLLSTGVLLLTIGIRGRVSTSGPVRGWSARTYAIYLVHPLCLYPVLDRLAPVIGSGPALLVALVLLTIVTELAHRWFEMPVNRWFRRWERTRRISCPSEPASSAGNGLAGGDRVG